VLTVEPAIYIKEEGFGVRLENTIVVTENGQLDLMADIPIEADEIEKLMKKGVGLACIHYAVEIPKGHPRHRTSVEIHGVGESPVPYSEHHTPRTHEVEHAVTIEVSHHQRRGKSDCR